MIPFKRNMRSLGYFAFSFIVICGAEESLDANNYEQSLSSSVIKSLVERMNDMETREASHIKALEELKWEHRLEIDGLKREIARQNEQLNYLQKKISGQARLLSKLLRRVHPRSMSPGKEPELESSAGIYVSSGRAADEKQDIPAENTGTIHKFFFDVFIICIIIYMKNKNETFRFISSLF